MRETQTEGHFIKYQGCEKQEKTGAVPDQPRLRRCDNETQREVLDGALGQKRDIVRETEDLSIAWHSSMMRIY